MGQLYNLSYNPALDGNAEPYSGAWLHTYIPGTTTNKATYTTDALSVANANPLEADSAGRFSAMFATEGEVFDLYLTDADGGNGRTFANVISLGGSSSTFEKDFGANGRFQVYGEGGVIQVETGDPDGDDVGGRGRYGGWDGTQGDAVEIDYALATFTGNQSVSGSASIGTDVDLIAPTSAGDVYAKLSTGTATAATDVDIALPAGFDSYVLEIDYLTTSVSGAVNARLAFDAGPTFKSGAGDYLGPTTLITGTTPGSTANSTSINITSPSVVGAGATYGRCELRIDSKAGLETMISGMCQVIVSTSALISWICGSTDAKNYGKATYIRLLATAGTTSFRWSLFGVPGL